MPSFQFFPAIALAGQSSKQVLQFPHPDSSVGLKVTLSLGVATGHPARQGTAAMLLEEVDRNLYEAKRLGRGQVHLAARPSSAVGNAA